MSVTLPLPLEGGCACGAVRYRVDAQPLMTFVCHCVECQKASGGPSVAAVYFKSAQAVTFTRGAPKTHPRPSTAGGFHLRGFCAECGSRLTGGQRADADGIGLVVSSFDDRSWFKPQMHFFVSQKQAWEQIPGDAPRYETYPPMPPSDKK